MIPMQGLKMGWKNAYYRATGLYLCTLVTLIFAFQMHRYFIADPSPNKTTVCPTENTSMATLIPLIGVLFDG